MAEILLSSEAFVKSVTSASDNLILPSLREAQEISLKGILGDDLLSKLKTLIKNNTLEAESNGVYKTLVDHCQYFLAYKTIVEVTNKVSYKIGNFGVTKTQDENLQVATQDEIAKMQYYYQSKADACCLDLQAATRLNPTCTLQPPVGFSWVVQGAKSSDTNDPPGNHQGNGGDCLTSAIHQDGCGK